MKEIFKNSIPVLLLCCFTSLVAQDTLQKAINDFHVEIPRLSPVPIKITNVQQPQFSLNGKWDFRVTGHNAKHTINVPGEWEMQGFKVNEGETAMYSRELNIPADWKGKRIKIRFDAISSHAVIKVNGIKVSEHEGSFVPFETDITSALKEDKNILQVEVQALTISDRLACTSQYAVHTVGGILRKVTLFVLPEVNIASTIVNTVFDKNFENATLQLNTEVANESSSPVATKLRYTLTDALGKKIIKKIFSVAETAKPILQTIAVKAPQQWNPEHPYLYQLTTELLVNGKILQTNTQHVGFRQIEIRSNLLFVNGMPIKLHGVNRHTIYPLTGRSIIPELDRKDAELFREANCNYIRTSHYPPSEEFLEAADSLGLFVESESSLCWILHGASPIWRKWDYLDPRFLPFMVQANVEKVIAQRNHPSIIIWSLANESRWSPLWAKVNAVVKQLDPSRPTTFHDQCWGSFNNAGSTADIAVYHYPGINGPAACDTMTRPVLFGEYAHLSCYNRRELLTDPGVRSAYGAPLVQMYDSMYHHSACLGGAIWSGIDDIFHMPDGRIIGYGPWGPIDGWRREKPEYWGMKKAYAPVVINNIDKPVISNGNLQLKIENRYDFTSLKEIKIICKVDGVSENIKANISPHGNGIVNIPIEINAREVYIAFVDPRGFVANEEKILFPKKIPQSANLKLNVTLTENAAAYFITQGDVQYDISKFTGIILSARKGNSQILTQGPVFGIVPMNDEDGGKPNVAGETYQNNIYALKNYPLYTLFAKNITIRQTDEGIKFSMDVTYTNASGKQSYLFGNDGKVVVEYEMKYKGVDSIPYQYGMIMQLPKTFDKLGWKRKGEFTLYPENDIARNEGTAMLNAKHINGVEEWGVVPNSDWKDDANDLGSNDFRSTKRNIYNASLTDKNNNSIKIISDGTQSARCWLQDEKIQLLIADYSNNGSEPFYGSPFTDGRIKIKNKTLKGKSTIIIQ